jgi:hypothetical protein
MTVFCVLYIQQLNLPEARMQLGSYRPVPEFIDPVFAKTSPKRSFSVIENERFGLVFAKTGSIISGTGQAVRSVMEGVCMEWTVHHNTNLILLESLSSSQPFRHQCWVISLAFGLTDCASQTNRR